MSSTRIHRCAFFACFLLLAPAFLGAQQPVDELRSLIGAPGSTGDTALRNRGYEHVGTEKTDQDSYAYWREQNRGRCIVVRTTNGRFASIVRAKKSDCDRVEKASAEASGEPDDGSFATVCGVEVDAKSHRYRCRLRNEGCEGQGFCRSILTYPDLELRISWLPDDRVEVRMKGVAPVQTKASFSDGQTRFEMDGKTYFVYRTPERAEKELAKLDR